jgi:putative DNA primase/helicase
MDAQKQNLGGNELVQRIKDELAENQHRYELHDPFAEVTFRLSTANEAIATAEKVGTTSFQEVTPDGQISQINQVNGEWKRDDGKSLKEVQAEIDSDSLLAIEARSEQRTAIGQGVDNVDRPMAVADAHAFRRIQDPALQQYAASLMADNADEYPEYKNSLDKAIPGYPGVAEKVAELSAEARKQEQEADARKMARDEAEYQDSLKKPSVEAVTQEPTSSNLPRMDVSDYGTWGKHVDESRDLADKHGLTEDIAKLAVAGKTANEIAQEMKDRLEAVNPAVEGENPFRENSNFVRRVRTSLGIPSVENTQDAALFEDWKAKAEARLNASSASEAAAGSAPETETPKADIPKAAPETIVIDQATKDRLAGLRARDSAQAKESLGLNSIEPDIERKQQKLDDEKEEAKRAAWLKKADETQQEAPPKKASDNKLESDEVFTATQEAKPLVPKEIEKQYLRVGDKYYHPKNADVLAFEDKGNKLETRSNSEQIAESMVRIAEARGWDEIKVSGSETFRREVWLEAASRGMHVKGYEPSEQDKAHLVKRSNDRQANNVESTESPAKTKEFRVGEKDQDKTVPNRGGTPTAETSASTPNASAATQATTKPESQESQAKAPERTADDKAIKATVGVLVAHGADKYLHDEKNTASYFVTTRDDKGVEKKSWGVDLKRAIEESGAKVGDKVAVANEGNQTVTIKVPVRDDSGKVVSQETKDVKRNTWNVQMAESFAKEPPAEAVKKYPELAGAYATVAAIDKKAEADGLDERQRAVVNAKVRELVTNSIERGDIPNTKLREDREVTRPRNNERDYSR